MANEFTKSIVSFANKWDHERNQFVKAFGIKNKGNRKGTNITGTIGPGQVIGLIVAMDMRLGNLDEFEHAFRGVLLKGEGRSLGRILRRFGERTEQVILDKYDATRSSKNKRRTGKFRSLIGVEGPFYPRGGPIGGNLISTKGSVVVTIGARVPNNAPFWRLLEEGVRPKTRSQWFRIAGTGRRGDKGNSFTPKRRVRDGRIDFEATIGQSQVTKKDLHSVVKGGLKLTPIKKGREGRIKNKVLLEFAHRGFKGGHFFAAGIAYAQDNIDIFIAKEFQKSIDAIVANSGSTKALADFDLDF